MITQGSKVKCKITGFEGIATARVEYINGCIQYCIKPKAGKDGKITEGEYLDEQQLEVVGEGVILKIKESGGPQRDCPKH